jgi:hypothetical protein
LKAFLWLAPLRHAFGSQLLSCLAAGDRTPLYQK